MKYLIVGLGNVGPEYELSRHNIGFSIIDQIAEKFDLKFSIEKHAEYCSFRYKSRNIHLLKPSTFVNNSGKAVNYWLSKLKINNDNRGNTHSNGPLVNTANPIATPASHFKDPFCWRENSHNATNASVIKKVKSMSMRAWLPR